MANILALLLISSELVMVQTRGFDLFASVMISITGDFEASVTKSEDFIEVHLRGVLFKEPWAKFDGDDNYIKGVFAHSITKSEVLVAIWLSEKVKEYSWERAENGVVVEAGKELPREWTDELTRAAEVMLTKKMFNELIDWLFEEFTGGEVDEQTRGIAFMYIGEALWQLANHRPERRGNYLLKAADMFRASASSFRQAASKAKSAKKAYLLRKATEVRLKAAYMLRRIGFFPEALVQINIVLKEAPNDKDALCEEGLALLGLGRAGESLTVFKRILSMEPEKQCAIIGMAATLYDIGDNAIHFFKKADEKLLLREPRVYLRYAKLLAEKSEYSKARVALVRLYAIPEVSAKARLIMSELELKAGNTKKALRDLYIIMDRFRATKEDFIARLKVIKLRNVAKSIPKFPERKYVLADPLDDPWLTLKAIADMFTGMPLGLEAVATTADFILEEVQKGKIKRSKVRAMVRELWNMLQRYTTKSMDPRIYDRISKALWGIVTELEKQGEYFYAAMTYLTFEEYFSVFTTPPGVIMTIAKSLARTFMYKEAEELLNFTLKIAPSEELKVLKYKLGGKVRKFLEAEKWGEGKSAVQELAIEYVEDLVKRGLCDEAILVAKKIKTKKFKDRLNLAEGLCLKQLGKLHLALKKLSGLREPKAVYVKAEILESLGRKKEALKIYSEALKTFPEHPMAKLSAFRAYLLAKEFEPQSAENYKDLFKDDELLVKASGAL